MPVNLARCVFAAALAFPSLGMAGDLSFSGGITATSNYLSDGFSNSGNLPALQPFLEVSKNGFYGGAWASNIQDEDGNQVEVELTAGYRGQLSTSLALDVSYVQYLYDKTKGYGELDLGMVYAVSDNLSLSEELTYDLNQQSFGATVGAVYEMSPGWSVYADVGSPDAVSPEFWDGGVSYAVNDKVTLDLQYQDTAASAGLVAASITYAFGAEGQ